MNSFSEFDIKKSNYLKQLKSISRTSGESLDRVIKCFLVFLFANEYASKERREKDIGNNSKLESLVSAVKYKERGRELIGIYSEIVYSIRKILEPNYPVDDPVDLMREHVVIREVSYLSTSLDLPYEGAKLFDYLFDYPDVNKIDSLVSMLVNKLSKNNDRNALVNEIPLLTGDVAINSLSKISLSDKKPISFYLGMKFCLHNVHVDYLNSSDVYFIRDIYHPSFDSEYQYYHAKPNAFSFLAHKLKDQSFLAMVLGNARGYGQSLNEFVERGLLKAVIELPASYRSKNKNLYIISSKPSRTSGVLFIDSSNIYSVLNEDDSLYSSFIQAVLEFDDIRDKKGNFIYGDESINGYVKRFFPYGYDDVPGLVYRATAIEIANNKSMNVKRYVSATQDKDVLFSPLDYSMIYQNVFNRNEIKGNYVIGNNGVGKSLLLFSLSAKLSKDDQRVLLASFGLSDRFYALKNESNVVYLGDRQNGKSVSFFKRNQEVFECVKRIYSSESTYEFFKYILNEIGLSDKVYCVPRLYAERNVRHNDFSEIITMDDLILNGGSSEGFIVAIGHVDNNQIVTFDNLSSGEQQLLLMFSRIISTIRNGDVFVVDEPEISMHIEWQQKIPYLFDRVSEQYSSPYVVATHSPIVISSVDVSKNNCYTASAAGLMLINKESVRNVESTILDSFNVITKNNRSVYEISAKTVSDFMMAVNNGVNVYQQYILSVQILEDLLSKLDRKNYSSLRNEKVIVRRALSAITELYQSQLVDYKGDN